MKMLTGKIYPKTLLSAGEGVDEGQMAVDNSSLTLSFPNGRGIPLLALCFSMLVSFCRPVRAAAGRAGGILFQEPFGARAFALGQAYAALGNDVYGMSYNPAILSRLEESQVAAQFIQSIGDVQMGYLGLASPLSPTQAMGIQLAYLDAGRIDIFDDNGNLSTRANAERDFLARLGYSRSFSWSSSRLHLGGVAQVLKSTLIDETQATAFAGDFGSLYEIPWRRGVASMGLVLSNFGPGIRYSGGDASGSQASPLPLTARLALGYAKEIFAVDSLGLGVEVDRMLYNNTSFEGVGVEYDYHHLCAVRLGYRLGQDLGNLTLGLGFNFNNFSIDYGMGLMQTFGNVQQFSLTYHFTVPGIRYGVQYSAGPTPLEALSMHVQKDIADKRYFDATDDLERLEGFFPGTAQGAALKKQIQSDIKGIVLQGASNPRYDYALGFGHYQDGNLKDALINLQAGFFKEPTNQEIQVYLDKAKKKYLDIQNQSVLQRQARIGVLFDLANQAYEDDNYPRALRIADEILRLGPYRPAESLKRKIAENSRKFRPRLMPSETSPRAPAPAAPAPAANRIEKVQPSPEDMSRAEQLYFEAVRNYAEYAKNSHPDDLQKALGNLKEAVRLNPNDSNIKTALENLQKELK